MGSLRAWGFPESFLKLGFVQGLWLAGRKEERVGACDRGRRREYWTSVAAVVGSLRRGVFDELLRSWVCSGSSGLAERHLFRAADHSSGLPAGGSICHPAAAVHTLARLVLVLQGDKARGGDRVGHAFPADEGSLGLQRVLQ